MSKALHAQQAEQGNWLVQSAWAGQGRAGQGMAGQVTAKEGRIGQDQPMYEHKNRGSNFKQIQLP